MLTLVLANPQHIKNVPGRKTDMKDAEWIAQLGRCGLIAPSYIPSLSIITFSDLPDFFISIQTNLVSNE